MKSYERGRRGVITNRDLPGEWAALCPAAAVLTNLLFVAAQGTPLAITARLATASAARASVAPC